MVLGTFAWMEATRIPYGIAQRIVALRYRPLTPLFLSLLEKILSAIAAWITKDTLVGHRPSEN